LASNGSCGCVEVRHRSRTVSIRDSKWGRTTEAFEPRPVITVRASSWVAFLGDLLAGEAVVNRELGLELGSDGSAALSSVLDGTTLSYTSDEWMAFMAGVRAGEFDRVAA
jgi:hypothetical protein